MKLTSSKDKGGMGFKDLNLLNVALLEKQCWRMMRYPEAWWVKILKGIYYPRCDILEAKKKRGLHGHGLALWKERSF